MSGPDLKTGREVWAICQRIASGVYIKRPPSEAYALRVARLLWGTAAHESGGFRYRRQLGFSLSSLAGGWGLWQIEHGSVTDSLYDVSGNAKLTSAVCAVLNDRGRELVRRWNTNEIIRATAFAEYDDVSCVLARMHYMRVRDAVPETPGGCAVYWKTWYNTSAGKGRPEQWLEAFNRLWRECDVQ